MNPKFNPYLFAWWCKASNFSPKVVEKWTGPAFKLPSAEPSAPAKKVKKVVIEKSLILFDVKPWGEETNLDELAKQILEISMDGLFWKT